MRKRSVSSAAAIRQRVLVVDDDADIRELVAEILEHAGYQVSTAGNGRDALAILHRGPPPHVIVLDLMMPVMTGWDLLEALRHRPKLAKVPVLVVSASSEPLPRNGGRTRLLTKPVRLDALLEAVNERCAAAEQDVA